jgi:hypothetical protein
MPDIDLYWHQQGSDRPAIGPIGPMTIQGGPDPVKTEAVVKGDGANPLTTVVLGDPAKPVTTLVLGDPNKPVTTLVLGDPNKPLTTLLEGDPNKPITFSIKDIPQIQLSADVGMKPTRIHNPLHYTFCISLFGLEIMTFAICGEGMTIIEPYNQHKAERCE